MLITRYGDERDVNDRYYIGHEIRAEHGGPSRVESEIPLVLAHPRLSRRELARIAGRALGASPTISDVGRLLIELRLAL